MGQAAPPLAAHTLLGQVGFFFQLFRPRFLARPGTKPPEASVARTAAFSSSSARACAAETAAGLRPGFHRRARAAAKKLLPSSSLRRGLPPLYSRLPTGIDLAWGGVPSARGD